ncbi:hypothetical protein GCM10028824_38130 [Hymenobacter segetis]
MCIQASLPAAPPSYSTTAPGVGPSYTQPARLQRKRAGFIVCAAGNCPAGGIAGPPPPRSATGGRLTHRARRWGRSGSSPKALRRSGAAARYSTTSTWLLCKAPACTRTR